MDQRQPYRKLIVVAALAVGIGVLPDDAAGQTRSNVATVSMSVTVPAGVRFVPTAVGESSAFSGGPAQPGFSLFVNAPYRLQVRTEPARGETAMLLANGRPGLVRLDGICGPACAATGGPAVLELIVAPQL